MTTGRLVPRASVLAYWKASAVYCGANECRERLGTAPYGASHEPFEWWVQAGYAPCDDGYWRYSHKYRSHHPVRSTWRGPPQRYDPFRPIRKRGWRGLPSRPPAVTIGSQSTLVMTGREQVAYIICRGRRCGAHNLVVPHRGVRSLPPRELLEGRCGRCPRCLAASLACEWDGACQGCLRLGSALLPS